jgi:hypothetical protein
MPEDRRVIEVMAGAQAGFVASRAKYPAYIAGRRGGKTSASVVKMMLYMQQNPGAYFMFTVPTLGDVDRILLPKMREFFGPWYGKNWGWLEKKSQIVFPEYRGVDGEGGIAFVRPASEPDSMRGPTLAAAAMDEIGTENQYEAFQILQPAVFGGQKGFPHQIWTTTTPRVEQKWVKQVWDEHVSPSTGDSLPAEDYPIFRARTVDNYHLDPESIQSLLSTYGSERDRQQELEGEFITLEGTVFDMLDPEVHLRYPPEDAEFTRTVFGFDIGGTSPTAIIQWKMDRQFRKYAVAEYYRANADEYDWIKWLADHNAMRVMCDPAIGENLLRYWRRKYNVHFARAYDKTHEGRLNVWRTGFNQRPPQIYISPDCPMLWDELVNLRRKRKGEDDYSEKQWASGVADHAYDAGAYGLQDIDRFKLALPQPAQLVGAVR